MIDQDNRPTIFRTSADLNSFLPDQRASSPHHTQAFLSRLLGIASILFPDLFILRTRYVYFTFTCFFVLPIFEHSALLDTAACTCSGTTLRHCHCGIQHHSTITLPAQTFPFTLPAAPKLPQTLFRPLSPLPSTLGCMAAVACGLSLYQIRLGRASSKRQDYAQNCPRSLV